MYSCLLEDLFDKKACEKDKKEKKKKGRTEEEKTRRKKYPNQTKKTKIAISVACILMRCKPLPNNISTENGKNDVL